MADEYRIGTAGDAEKDLDRRIRLEWSESVQDHLEVWTNPETGERGMNRKELQKRLEAVNVRVTLQTISMWLTGQTAPRPSAQIGLGRVLNVPPRRLFPLEMV